MPDQTNFLSATQSSFLSALPETKENQVITGFDTFAAVQFCTPSFLGCKLCIGANVVGGFITLTVQASTPVGGFSKSFKITNNISFSWNPIGVFKVDFKISNFKKTGSTFSFNASFGVCLHIPFLGWKCATYSHTFTVPTIIHAAHLSVLNAKEEDNDSIANSQDYSTLLLLHALVEDKESCNCH